MKNKNNKVIVIVGASSGIGRATALTFAAQGNVIVLAARRKDLLETLAAECEALGSQAISLQTDVTEPAQVQYLADEALKQYGRIDVWVNNAGIGAVGEFTKTPLEAHERVIQTNLMGCMNGAYAVLPYFKEQNQGILINTISIGAWVPQPYTVAYHASKFGIRGFSEALRAELSDTHKVKICDVFPAYIDTPGFQHGANYMGKKIKPIPPVYDAQLVADAIVSLAQDPKDSVTVGAAASVLKAVNFLFPELVRRSLKMVMDNYFQRADPAPISDNGLFEASYEGTGISGGWNNENKGRTVGIFATAVLLGVAGVAFFANKAS